MVKVQIPLGTPKDDEDGKNNGASKSDEVGIMGDIEESDVDDDIGDPDWEEVMDDNGNEDDFSFKSGKMLSLPEDGVTIYVGSKRRPRMGKASKNVSAEDLDLEEDEVVAKKKKKTLDINEMVRKSINRVKITEQLYKHKVSLLLYLARGLRLVRIINCNIIRGLSMSIANHFKIAKTEDREFLVQFIDQFEKVFTLSSDDERRSKHMQQPFMLNLLECFSILETTSLIELTVIFVACLKILNPDLPTRIVNVLRPLSLRTNIIPKPKEGGANETNIKLELPPDNSGEIVEKLDFWVEVYLANEHRWCCVDLCNLTLDEPSVLTELGRPFYYLVTYDVDRQCVKPAEKNYVQNWYTPAFRKGRCEDKWWNALMSSIGPTKNCDKDLADELKTEEILTKQDIPTSDNAFRNHPLYVLEKHLLKFQGIYPPEVAPLCFFKDQPVYPRDCVQVLRSRETWLRQARSVKLNESAYKIVKSRPKRDKYTGDWIRDLPLEIFGEWQTEPYDPPKAEGGKVPRNCYGNVDMYQECMLPKGCKWLRLQGLAKIANKLGIDCAPAVVGFDSNCGSFGSHPVVDGFIVCEEFAETLQMAWEEEQHNIAQREEDKRQRRVWENWKRLLKAVKIREKLRVKYQHS